MILAIIIAAVSLLIAPSLVLATDIPIQISPVDNSTIIQLKPKLTWQYSGSCPIDPKISCFRVELDTSPLFPNPKYKYTNSFSYSPQTLTDGKWYWKVKAKDASEIWSDWSAIWSFILATSTPSPNPVQTVSPTPTPSSTLLPSSSFNPKPVSLFIISDVPPQINSDQSFNVPVNLTLPNNKNADYYLSGAFKKVDGTRYFGLTKINSSWIKYESSNYLNQYKITTDDNGIWTGNLEVKPDTSDTDYKGSGDYIFKVSRYTANGSQAWSDGSTIKIISAETESDQGETLTDTSVPSINPTTLQSSPKTKTTTSSKSKSYDRLVYHTASVAAATVSASSSATPSAETEVKNQKQINPIIWIGLVFILAGASSISYIYLKRHAKIPL